VFQIDPSGFSDTTKAIDAGDTVHFASPDSIYFDLDTDNGMPAEQDKFSFVAKEINWVTVTDSTGTFGTLNTNIIGLGT